MTDAARKAIKAHRKGLVRFLRELVAIPSESGREKQVIDRIGSEMVDARFESIKVDGMGNILGMTGRGRHLIAMDAHVDTVGTGDRGRWKWDPYLGKEEKGKIYGRGTVDQKAGMASLIYGARLINDLELFDDYRLLIVGSVQEEDCDGLCWRHLIEREGIRPSCVVITEPTGLNIHRGHRGRMEIDVTTHGVAAHGSMPSRGVNAVYKMTRVIREVEKLNEALEEDPFLGKGTVAVTDIQCSTPSRCAIPDRCTITLDRRLSGKADRDSAIEEVREAVRNSGVEAHVEIPLYHTPGYLGTFMETERYFPTWTLPLGHILLEAACQTSRFCFSREPQVGKWTFSTNGTATMGIHGIPTIGFGPGDERLAHTTDEHVAVRHLVLAALWYAHFPAIYGRMKGDN